MTKKSHALRFWIVTMICAAMIGLACYFAYTQTANELTVQLETTVGSLTDMPATNPPYTKPAQLPLTTPVITERVIPTETAVQTTATAAAAPAAAQTVLTETVTETVQTETTAVSAPRCKPVEGEVLQPFSGGALVKSPTTGVWQTHNGTDYAAALGDTVRASDAGVVSQVEEDPLWGITVTIDHRNGILTRYCNLNAGLSVCEGDNVESSTVIGAVGSTADAESGEPSHLHFEVIKDGRYLDPETYLAE